jgi:guanylate kinase
VGKGTLLRQLCDRHPELHVSVSATTRSPRPGEQHGQHYYFYSREQFLALRDAGEFLEWAEYAGNFYGTPHGPVLETLRTGRDVLLEIELQGARQIGRSMPQALRVFIQPPSVDELERRLRQRGQDREASIQKRLLTARHEIEAAAEFDVIITNDQLDSALDRLETALYGSPSVLSER